MAPAALGVVTPNDLAALSNLVAIPVVWNSARAGGHLWAGCLLLAAGASLAYHAAETTRRGYELEGARWARSWQPHDELLLAVDRACAVLAVASTLSSFWGGAGGSLAEALWKLAAAPLWLLWAAAGLVALAASEPRWGFVRWQYAVLHSVWHISAMTCAGALVRMGGEAAARQSAADILVVGLGNPGAKYKGSRHNIGFEVVDLLARRAAVELRPSPAQKAHKALLARSGQSVLLARPDTFMNASGRAVAALCEAHGVREGGKVVVIHDELDLPPGRMKLKLGGSEAGHNGLRSIVSCIGTSDFVRVRVGVGERRNTNRGVGRGEVGARRGVQGCLLLRLAARQ